MALADPMRNAPPMEEHFEPATLSGQLPATIWGRMSKEEQDIVIAAGFCGLYMGTDRKGNIMVAVGRERANEIIAFKQSMIDKYRKKADPANNFFTMQLGGYTVHAAKGPASEMMFGLKADGSPVDPGPGFDIHFDEGCGEGLLAQIQKQGNKIIYGSPEWDAAVARGKKELWDYINGKKNEQ